MRRQMTDHQNKSLYSPRSQQLHPSREAEKLERVALPKTGERNEKRPCGSLPQDRDEKLPRSTPCPYLPLFWEESQSILPRVGRNTDKPFLCGLHGDVQGHQHIIIEVFFFTLCYTKPFSVFSFVIWDPEAVSFSNHVSPNFISAFY